MECSRYLRYNTDSLYSPQKLHDWGQICFIALFRVLQYPAAAHFLQSADSERFLLHIRRLSENATPKYQTKYKYAWVSVKDVLHRFVSRCLHANACILLSIPLGFDCFIRWSFGTSFCTTFIAVSISYRFHWGFLCILRYINSLLWIIRVYISYHIKKPSSTPSIWLSLPLAAERLLYFHCYF